MSKRAVIISVVIGCILLAIANVSLWITLNVLNAERFGELVAEGLQSQEASQAIAGEVVDHFLSDYPVVRAVAGPVAEDLIAGLLQHEILTSAIETVATAANLALTKDLRDFIPLEVQEIAPFVVGVVYAVDPVLAEQISATLTSEPITLLTIDELPNLSTVSGILPWIWPIAALAALGLFLLAVFRGSDRARSVVYTGAGIAITGGIMLLFIPAIRLTSTGNIETSTALVVVGSVVDALIRGYIIQDILLIIVGLIIVLAGRNSQSEAQEAVSASE